MGSTAFRFHEGCLEHKWESSYRKLWMVMKKNIIYIFRDRPYIPENHEGTLTIDHSAKFELRSEKPNNYKFILYTSNRRRVNTFKSDKKSERDLWRGYIVGVAKQKVPDDLDLPRDIISRIKQDVANYHLDNSSPEIQIDANSRTSGSNVSSASTRQSISNRSNPNRHSFMSGDSGVSVSVSQRSPSSGSGSMTIEGVGGGPFMRHKFTNIPGDSVVPSWFFEACTREKAETILTIADLKGFGDTLMRESTKFKQDGSYVISKRNMSKTGPTVEHYEVIRVDKGYKIKVENQHDAMKNLTDVMNYFVQTAGSYNTKPLTTNRPVDYGMSEDPYNTGRIQLTGPSQEILYTRQDNFISHNQYNKGPSQEILYTRQDNFISHNQYNKDTVAAVLAEPEPDYEEPVPSKSPPVHYQHKTVTPNTTKSLNTNDEVNFHQSKMSYSTERLANNYKHQPGKPSIDEIQTNIKTAATLQMLDKTIDPFDEPAREEDYVNLRNHAISKPGDDSKTQCQPPPPPTIPIPPIPASQTQKLNYEEPKSQAPPLPSRSTGTPSLADKIKNVHLHPVKDKSGITNTPPPAPLLHSQSAPAMTERDGVPTPQQLGLRPTNFKKADPSQGEIMRPTGRSLAKTKSLDLSSTVPTPQQMGLRPTKHIHSHSESAEDDKVDVTPEIDQSHVGGVSSIKNRFEKHGGPAVEKQGTGVSHQDADLAPPKKCTPAGQGLHDDTDYVDAHSKPVACGRQNRSKSTPTIGSDVLDRLRVTRGTPGTSSFIRKLEGVIGGQQKTPHPQSQHVTSDELYEYLPD